MEERWETMKWFNSYIRENQERWEFQKLERSENLRMRLAEWDKEDRFRKIAILRERERTKMKGGGRQTLEKEEKEKWTWSEWRKDKEKERENNKAIERIHVLSEGGPAEYIINMKCRINLPRLGLGPGSRDHKEKDSCSATKTRGRWYFWPLR